MLKWLLGYSTLLIPLWLWLAYTTAADIWAHLKKVYHQTNKAQNFHLDSEITKFTQGDKSVQEYFNGFVTLWTERDFMLIQTISSGFLSEALKLQEETHISQFLMMNLRSEFEYVRSALMNREIYANLDTCFQKVLREKLRFTSQRAILEEPKASSHRFRLTLLFWQTPIRSSLNVMNAKPSVILPKTATRSWSTYITNALVILLMTVAVYNEEMRHNRRSLPPLCQERISPNLYKEIRGEKLAIQGEKIASLYNLHNIPREGLYKGLDGLGHLKAYYLLQKHLS